MKFDETVAEIFTACPDARAIAIVGPDGIPVVSQPDEQDLEVLSAEMAALLHELNQAARELEHGDLRQFTAAANRAKIVLTAMAEGYFILAVLEPDAISGRARLACRLAGLRLQSEFI